VISLFFFQAEDGIRDRNVTGVQTCALPICQPRTAGMVHFCRDPQALRIAATRLADGGARAMRPGLRHFSFGKKEILPSASSMAKIGRASCREGVYREESAVRGDCVPSRAVH